jgi:hypothetical protein
MTSQVPLNASARESGRHRRSRVARGLAIGLGMLLTAFGARDLMTASSHTPMALGAALLGVLLLVPATRRWAAGLTSFLLLGVLILAREDLVATACVVLLFTVAALVAFWTPPRDSPNETLPLFFILVLAAFTWAGLLRFRRSAPPEPVEFTVETEWTLRGLSRLLVYTAGLFADWCGRIFESVRPKAPLP